MREVDNPRPRWTLVALLGLASCVGTRGPLPTGTALDRELSPPALNDRLRGPTPPLREQLPRVTIDATNGLSPDEAALIAVAVNPSLQAVRDERGIAHSQVVQAGILPNPSLAVDVGAPVNGPTSGTQLSYGVGLSWNLTPLLSVATAVEAARLGLESVELDIAWQEWQVAQAARLHAGQLIFIERRLAIADESVGAFQAQVDVIQKALDDGNSTILQLATAQSAMQTAMVTKLRTQQEHRVTRLKLLQALGVPPAQELDVDPQAPMPRWSQIPSLESILASLPEQRLDLRGLHRAYTSQSASVRVAAIRRFPPLKVEVGHSQDTSGLGVLGFSVNLGIPFFDRNQGQVAKSRATQAQIFDQYLARVQSARFEVAQALANLQSVREQIEVVRSAVPTLQDLVDLAQQQAGEGNVSLVDLYDLRVRLLTRQLALQLLLQSEMELGISLDIAAGRILADPPDET